jgi:hypothetical protein
MFRSGLHGEAAAGRDSTGGYISLEGVSHTELSRSCTRARPPAAMLCPPPCAGGRQDAGLLSWLGGVVAEAVRAAEEAEATGAAVAAHRAAIQRAYRLADLQVTQSAQARARRGSQSTLSV